MDAQQIIVAARQRIAENDPNGALRVLASDPQAAKTADGYFLTAVAYFRNNDWNTAEDYARLALGQDNMHAEACFYLGLALDRQNRIPEATRAVQAALRIDPSMQQARNKLASYGVAVPSIEVRPSVPRPQTKPPVKPATTELTMPRTQREWKVFESDINRKKLLERRAETRAEVSGLPWWGKFLVAVIAIFILWGIVSNLGTPSGFDEVKQQQDEIQQRTCEIAREAGQNAPGC